MFEENQKTTSYSTPALSTTFDETKNDLLFANKRVTPVNEEDPKKSAKTIHTPSTLFKENLTNEKQIRDIR
tara:strand:+ start:494 stop:706 length:213 start_codon:yes stop_codon:yes gene_type:complete